MEFGCLCFDLANCSLCVANPKVLCVFGFPEEAMPPYSKPSFPSPGGHSSSGTASSKGSTGPRKGEGQRGQQQQQPQQQRVATEHLDGNNFLGTNGQPQYSGELCMCNTPQLSVSSQHILYIVLYKLAE